MSYNPGDNQEDCTLASVWQYFPEISWGFQKEEWGFSDIIFLENLILILDIRSSYLEKWVFFFF